MTSTLPRRRKGGPAPTSGVVRKERLSPQIQDPLAAAPFRDGTDRVAFLELAYDLQSSRHIHEVRGQTGSQTYGDLGPALLGKLNLRELLSMGDLMVDLGSGIGHPAMYAGLLCGCDTVSYEISDEPAKIAVALFRTVAQKCRNEGYSMGSHAFIHADMTIYPSVGTAIACAKVILINNKAFTADLRTWLDKALKLAPPGTHIFVTQPLGTIRDKAHSSTLSQNIRKGNDISLSMERLEPIIGRPGWAHGEITVDQYAVKGHRSFIPSFWPDSAASSLWQPTDPPHETSCTIHHPFFHFSVSHDIHGARPKLYYHRQSEVEEMLHTEDDIPHWGPPKLSKTSNAARKRVAQRRHASLMY
ncbi:histone methylation protein DOT1-domain-containing protein [Mycena vulgaris]|nr:histone methylation protein DOT1-domain-containing protein [Mycena vulgaris]